MSQAESIDAGLVRRLVRAQFPRWADLPVEPVAFGGWDNRSFRLGERMVVRLPSAEIYAPQVEKEQHWLPLLAPMLPVAIPVPLAMGRPGEGYAWPWSVYAWLEGDTADRGHVRDAGGFAVSLAGFMEALQRIEPTGGPPPGPHNFHRGGQLAVYDGEARARLHCSAIGSMPKRQSALGTRPLLPPGKAPCVAPRGFEPRQPAGAGRDAKSRDRFRLLRSGRSRMRPGARLDLLRCGHARRIPRRLGAGSGQLAPWPRLGLVEGPHRVGRHDREQPAGL